MCRRQILSMSSRRTRKYTLPVSAAPHQPVAGEGGWIARRVCLPNSMHETEILVTSADGQSVMMAGHDNGEITRRVKPRLSFQTGLVCTTGTRVV